MLLRRVIEHVKAQNWTAVALDFVIVVVGVFIGIQVSNWNAARVERELAREYIGWIQEDLLANQQDMEMRSQYFSNVRRHALVALEGRREPAGNLDEQYLVSSFIAAFSLRRSFQRNTFDELLSSGAMNTIPNVETRRRIAEYYRIIDGAEYYLITIPSYVDALRRTMPYEVQAALRSSGCNAGFATSETGSIAAFVPQECTLDISPDLTTAAIETLLSADLEPDLIRTLADVDLKLQLFQVHIERAQSLYDYLEKSK